MLEKLAMRPAFDDAPVIENEDLVGIESRDRLGPVPAGVARRPGKERIANRRLAGRLPQVARVGAEPVHAPRPSRPRAVGVLIAAPLIVGRRRPLRIDPC